MKVAIVHDFMVGGGAERVVDQLLLMYPEATLYTACINDHWAKMLDARDVRTGVMQGRVFQKMRKYLPLARRWWFESLDLDEFDMVISSSGAEAKAVFVRGQKRTWFAQLTKHKIAHREKAAKPAEDSEDIVSADAIHISYCHSPTHYYWVRYDEYIKNPGFGMFDWAARLGLRILVGSMRRWDYRAAQRAHFMIANSTCVQARIKQYYGRDSVVVHPPVDTERFVLGEEDRKGYIVAGRQTPYKRIDLAVAACSEAGLPLKVIGNGPEHDKLVRLARPTIEFLTGVSDADMPEHFAGARAFIFANEDDFGIVPVEAMATGTPVIAFRKGGALDYVRPGVSGQFFDTQTAECLANALKEFEKTSYDPKAVRLVAEEFSAVHFQRGIEQVVSGAFGK